jgi:glycosyltransferase involved in cell wall biosynthesis
METKIPTKFDINYNPTPFYMKSVEIIIPFYGQHAAVMELIQSIFRTVNTNRYLITLVDDGSRNGQFQTILEKSKLLGSGLRYLRQAEQLGFAAAINYAISNPSNFNIPFVCVMQSDTRADNLNWLEHLGNCLLSLKSQNVKMVAPLTNNPLAFESILQAENHVLKKDTVLKDAFLPMYCFLCHRELFSAVGPLKEFPLAGVECEDYFFRMMSKKYFQAVAGNSWIFHQGRATIQQYDKSKKIQEILRNAKDKFYSDLQKIS